MKKLIIIATLIVSASKIAYAQFNFNKEKLDNYFNALEQNNKFMGSVAVSKNGEIIYSKSVGFADVANNAKASENTKYRIGSISKTFTTVLVLKAVEQKKLHLNQTINKWFPTIKNANKITIKQLLQHRSGIHSFTDDENFLTWNTQAKTEKEMLDIITKGGSDFDPDSKAVYSNSNFVLLTYILEKINKSTFANLLNQQIVKPIGLKNTYVFNKINTSNNECKSYTFNNNWKEEAETHYSIPLGAGAITSTASDLTKFADALFAGKLVSNNGLQLMKTIVDDYGMGLFKIPFNKSIGFGHTGGIDGFNSILAHFPDQKISYALTCNGSNFETNYVSIAVLSAINDLPYDIPSFTTYNVNAQDLDKYLGVYSSKQIPLKITITKDGTSLVAQGTGQPAFVLEATDKDKFKFDKASAKFEFDPAQKTMMLLQGGGKIFFTKE